MNTACEKELQVEGFCPSFHKSGGLQPPSAMPLGMPLDLAAFDEL